MQILGMLLLFTVLVLVLGYTFRPRRSHDLARFPRLARLSRHGGPVVGGVLLLALILGTLDHVHRTYDASGPSGLRIPDVPVTDSGETERLGSIDASRARVLLQVVVAAERPWGMVPLATHLLDPTSSGGAQGAVRGATYDLTIELCDESGSRVPGMHADVRLADGRVHIEGQLSFQDFKLSGMSGVSRWTDLEEVARIATMSAGRTPGGFLTLRWDPPFRVVFYARPFLAERGTPLVPRPLDDWLERHGPLEPPEGAGVDPVEESDAPGFALATHLGMASLTLLGVAICFMLPFRNRPLALAAVLAALVFLVAGVDRWMLGLHAERARDASRHVAERCVAATSLAGTFFYRDSAFSVAQELARSTEQPDPVRRSAGEAVRSLRILQGP